MAAERPESRAYLLKHLLSLPARIARLMVRTVLRAPALAHTHTRVNLRKNRGKPGRRLEIGPGPQRIEGFETLNVVGGLHVDYVADATKHLPFPKDTFEVVYASHILEHVPWYGVQDVLKEWARVLRPGGTLEIWVPDGLKICKAFVDAEETGGDAPTEDPWRRFNPDDDACTWACGRIFTYGDGSRDLNGPNWHRALFSQRYLRQLFEKSSLENVRVMDRSEVRGHDHGWINLGMRGVKP